MWIACKDKMPDNERDVLIYCDNQIVIGSLIYAGADEWSCDEIDDFYPISGDRVTHWAELLGHPK